MSEVRGFQRSQSTRRNSQTDFIVVDNFKGVSLTGEHPEPIMVDADTGVSVAPPPEQPSIRDSQIIESFGNANPILSSGEWQESELLPPPALKRRSLYGLFVSLFYS